MSSRFALPICEIHQTSYCVLFGTAKIAIFLLCSKLYNGIFAIIPIISAQSLRCPQLKSWFAFRFFNFTDIHNLKLYMWLILNELGCVVQRKNPAIFSLDFFVLHLFFGSYKSYNTGALVWTTCIMHVSAVLSCVSQVLKDQYSENFTTALTFQMRAIASDSLI